ncbi:uncharacterized protein EI90DRAFT_3157355 [Cantharellus anzutake]|uniref:uncharacterized protein n=1 Tax=Cantharellus anzutake TaxID=1750568 RepID=UPI0019058A5D|nr:uncharacterized protein EI90DRAFT_3157355 [Cantharellus anzutake]KAF8324442.1 hypothetical protein EI90DRAFT_3157355 [Cantharellus anzutake]
MTIFRMLCRTTPSRVHIPTPPRALSQFATSSRISENELRTNVVGDTLSYALVNAARLRPKEGPRETSRERDLREPPPTHNGPEQHSQSYQLGSRPRTPLKYPQLSPFDADKLPGLIRHDPSAVSLVSNFHRAVRRSDRAEAWDAYQAIAMTHPMGSNLLQPDLLHRLALLLAKARPKTRENFLRLLAVISELRNMQEEVHLWEWNALIHLAGSGFRKAELEDFDAALKIVEDMQSSFSGDDHRDSALTTRPVFPKANLDVWTLNSLLNVAARTRSADLVKRALTLFDEYGIDRDRITHLTLIKHYGNTGALERIPPTIETMLRNDINPGIDGINSVIWAYGRTGRLENAVSIYRALQGSLLPDEMDSHPILCISGIENCLNQGPDIITFRCIIQCLAYHGDFIGAIEVFRDMLTTPCRRQPWRSGRLSRVDGGTKTYDATADVFRALFIGFTRHGVAPVQNAVDRIISYGFANTGVAWSPNISNTWAARKQRKRFGRRQLELARSTTATTHPEAATWTSEDLNLIFSHFLEMLPSNTPLSPDSSSPPNPPINPDIIYLCLVAFARTSHNDREVMRAAWQDISRAFGWIEGEQLDGTEMHDFV